MNEIGCDGGSDTRCSRKGGRRREREIQVAAGEVINVVLYWMET